jgi:universal stress protein E
MQRITRVIVANDSLDGMDSALAKAAMIEHYTGAEVRALTVTWDAVAEEPADVVPEEQRVQLIEALKAAERQGLRRLTEPYRSRVAAMDAQVLWSKEPRESILHAVAHAGAELLIKPASAHHAIGDFFNTPLDWTLMRESPCAVLLSRRAAWTLPGTVLAAVDVTDVRHLALTRAVLETAATLAGVLGAALHVATAYPRVGQASGADPEIAVDYDRIRCDMHENRRKALVHWAETLSIEFTGMHVLEGKPAVVIPELANQLDATLTVLGTAARSGLGKLLIGNTAEDTIGRIRGDLVTVREPWN